MDKKEILKEARAIALSAAFGIAVGFGIPITLDYFIEGCGPTERIIGRVLSTECSPPKVP